MRVKCKGVNIETPPPEKRGGVHGSGYCEMEREWIRISALLIYTIFSAFFQSEKRRIF